VSNGLSSAVPGYNLAVSQSPGGTPTTPGAQTWVRGTAYDRLRTVTIDFGRDLDPATVDTTTVQVVDGRLGTAVPATVSYDGTTDRVTVQALAQPAGPTMRIEVDGVTDAAGNPAPPLTLRYSDPTVGAPPAPSGLTATGGVGFVRLAWTVPDDDEITAAIVRSAVGSTPPGTGGTRQYDGYGSSLLITGLVPGQTYTFGVTTVASYQESTAVTVVVTGTAISVVASPSPLTYGAITTVTATTTNPVTHAPAAGRSVGIYWRRAGTTAWTAVKVGSTDASGHLAVLAKPPWNAEFYAVDLGGPHTTGATQTITTPVRFGVSEHLSATTALLGVPVALTGAVTPARAGQPVLLEGYWLGNWHIVTSAAMSSTGGYAFALRLGTRSTFTFRVYKQNDATISTGVSPTFTLRVV
jgi:hypothetical protein